MNRSEGTKIVGPPQKNSLDLLLFTVEGLWGVDQPPQSFIGLINVPKNILA